jgi:hypothetical protein
VIGFTAADEFGYVVDVGDFAYSNRVEKLQMIPSGKPVGLREDVPIEYGFTDAGINDAKGALSGDGVATTWVSRRSPIVTAQCRSDIVAYNYACPQSNLLMFRYINAPSRWIWMVEDSGETHGLGQAWTFDAQVRHENAAWIKSGSKYEIVRDADATTGDTEFIIDPAAGRAVELVMRAGASPSRFTVNASPVSTAGSLTAMRAAATSSYFYDSATRKLHMKLVGAASAQNVVITAPWELTAASEVGRDSRTPTGLTPGFKLAYFNSAAPNVLRHGIPTTTPQSTSSANDPQLLNSATLSRIPSGSNDTTVFTGYVNAASAGFYKMSAPAIAAHVDVYVGNVWVTGSRDNRITVLNQPGLSDADFLETGKVWLKAGWHPISVVVARDNATYGTYNNFPPQFWLMWGILSSNTKTFANIFRTP